MAAMVTPDGAVNAFVLEFSDAYWQLPLRDDERKYFCATVKFRGKTEVPFIPARSPRKY